MDPDMKIPVVITVYADRSFTFETKTPPAADLLKKAAGIAKGLGHAEQREGRHHHTRQDRGDRQDEDARPEHDESRIGDQDHRGHGANMGLTIEG